MRPQAMTRRLLLSGSSQLGARLEVGVTGIDVTESDGIRVVPTSAATVLLVIMRGVDACRQVAWLSYYGSRRVMCEVNDMDGVFPVCKRPPTTRRHFRWSSARKARRIRQIAWLCSDLVLLYSRLMYSSSLILCTAKGICATNFTSFQVTYFHTIFRRLPMQ